MNVGAEITSIGPSPKRQKGGEEEVYTLTVSVPGGGPRKHRKIIALVTTSRTIDGKQAVCHPTSLHQSSCGNMFNIKENPSSKFADIYCQGCVMLPWWSF